NQVLTAFPSSALSGRPEKSACRPFKPTPEFQLDKQLTVPASSPNRITRACPGPGVRKMWRRELWRLHRSYHQRIGKLPTGRVDKHCAPFAISLRAVIVWASSVHPEGILGACNA